MHYRTAFAVLLGLVACLTQAQASSDLTPKEFFIGQAQSLLSSAKSLGITEFGGINLEKFSTDINTLDVEFVRFQFLNTIGEENDDASMDRVGGHYRPKQIVFTQSSLDTFYGTELFPMFAVHECLGALGYSDRKYERSMPLYREVQSRIRSREAKIKSVEQAIKSSPLLASQGEGGGGTHAGGGGDTVSIRMREDILKLYEKKIRRKSNKVFEEKRSEFIRKLDQVAIEPNARLMFEGPKPQDKNTFPFFAFRGSFAQGNLQVIYNPVLIKVGDINPDHEGNYEYVTEQVMKAIDHL